MNKGMAEHEKGTGRGEKPVVLIVDDTPLNLQVAADILQDQYRILSANSGARALEIIDRRPDISLVLLDVMMPEMNGYEACRRMKASESSANIPIIFLTALSAPEDENKGFAVGGSDFVCKPFQPEILLARVSTHVRLYQREVQLDALVRERTQVLEARTEELEVTRLEVIQQLGRAAEFKDDDTGMHVIRMSHYSRLLADAAGLPRDRADLIFKASPLHDIGKLGIPDHILKKPGKLTEEEFAIMRKHPEIGAGIIGERKSDLMICARLAALTHHEKWNGSGYPFGKAGEDIPVEGRIIAISDVFDALTSVRPYKPAWPVEKAVSVMMNDAGQHFDPVLLPKFFELMPELLKVKEEFGNDKAEPI